MKDLEDFFKNSLNALKKPAYIKREFDLQGKNFTKHEIKKYRNEAIEQFFPKEDESSLSPSFC